MINLDTMGMDCVISDLCSKGIILQRNYSWSFSCNSYVKYHDSKNWEPQLDHVLSKSVL